MLYKYRIEISNNKINEICRLFNVKKFNKLIFINVESSKYVKILKMKFNISIITLLTKL